MSKELTEQWRNITLPLAKTFWCCDKDGNIAKLIHIRGEFFEWTISENNVTKDVTEVLAKVPTYDQFVELTEKVEKLEKLLKECKGVIDECVRSDYIKELKERIDEVLRDERKKCGNILLNKID